MATAVCLTGMERSFAEIGGNIREGLYSALSGASDVRIFGVRPPSDAWSSIFRMLPISPSDVEVQRPCWTARAQNATRWEGGRISRPALREATARLFADEGAKVVIGDVLEEEGRATAADIGDAARFVRLDVSVWLERLT